MLIKQMYPHPVDRYRIAAILLDDAIKRNGGPREVARRTEVFQERGSKSGVSETTVYDMRYVRRLTRRARRGEDGATREAIVKVLGKGLEVSPIEIDLFLWLLTKDFEPTVKTELDYWETKQRAEVRTYVDEQPLRKRTLELLRKVCNQWMAATPKEKTVKMVKMMLVLTEDDRLESTRELLAFDKEDGQCMSVLKYPTHLTWHDALINSNRFVYPEVTSVAGKREARRLRIDRWQAFRKHLGIFGGRAIFSRSGFETYLNGDGGSLLSFEQRRSHVKNILALLHECEHYNIVLTDAEISTEIALKSTSSAVIRGAPGGGNPFRKKITCGPAYVYFVEPIPVLSFVLDFEREWDTAWNEIGDPSRRTKAYVVDWLERLLHKYAKK